MKNDKSSAIYKKACTLIPGGVNSPVRAFKGLGLPSPLIAESGTGAMVRDADGNEYIDYCMSWGALILGHAHPDIVDAAVAQMRRGSSFGIATNLEVEMAEKIAALVPSIEKIRLVSSGTEATMTAMRLARGYTEKTKIIKFSGHYHGHSDGLLVQAGSGVASLNPIATSLGVNPAVLADTLCFPFNDFQAVRSFFRTDPRSEDLAAVILEPVTGNMGVVLPEPGFLEMLREETARVGALLIFDEVITGFRVGLSGAQGLFGTDPDLSCFGKVIGAGFPVAAVGGKKKILDCLAPLGQVYQAGTLSGNPVGVAAGLAALKALEMSGFYEKIAKKANRLTDPIREAIRAKNLNACVNQCGSMFSLFFGISEVKSKEDVDKRDHGLFVRLFQALLEKGIYLPPSSHEAWFVSLAHTEDQLDFTAEQIVSFMIT
jgi:glutamate-1-semialdehyde 2,1-aminomutase